MKKGCGCLSVVLVLLTLLSCVVAVFYDDQWQLAVINAERASIEGADAGNGNAWLQLQVQLTHTGSIDQYAKDKEFLLKVDGQAITPDRDAGKTVERLTGRRSFGDSTRMKEHQTETRTLVFKIPVQGQRYTLTLDKASVDITSLVSQASQVAVALPTPTPLPTATVMPTATIPPPTSTPAPPTPTFTPAPPTPTPTPLTTPGKGTIVFGTDYRETTKGFEVVNPRTTFTPGDNLAYVAQFKDKAGATVVERLITSVSPNGAETTAFRKFVDVADPAFTLLAGELGQFCRECRSEQTYKLKFVRGGTVLAEGQFSFVPGQISSGNITVTDREGKCQMLLPAGFRVEGKASQYFWARDKLAMLEITGKRVEGIEEPSAFEAAARAYIDGFAGSVINYRQGYVNKTEDALRVDFSGTFGTLPGQGGFYFEKSGATICIVTLFVAQGSTADFASIMGGVTSSLQVTKP